MLKQLKSTALSLLLLVILLAPAYANAHTKDYFNHDHSVIYQVHHKITKWNTTDDYRFVKYIAENEKPQYWIAYEAGNLKDKPLDKAEIVIDSTQKYTVSLSSHSNNRYYMAMDRAVYHLFYDLSDDIIKEIKNSKSSIEIRFLFDNKPIIWSVSQGKLDEFKAIIDLQ